MDGTPFGRYGLIELLGCGGRGEMWRASDTESDRIVALEVPPAHFFEDACGTDQRPARPAPAQTGLRRPSRRPTSALIAGAVALIVVVPAAVGCASNKPSQSSLPSSQTSTQRPYSAQVVLPFHDVKHPNGVAVDSVGNLYVADTTSDQVLELPVGSSSQEVLSVTDLRLPIGVAVDSAAALYVTHGGFGSPSQVLKLPAHLSQTVLPFTDLSYPFGMAVDSAGNVYVVDHGNNQVVKLAAGSSSQTVLPFTGLNHPYGVAVDSAGNLYVSNTDESRVLKLAAGSSSQTVLPFIELYHPYGVAVDSAGNVYVADNDNNRVVKLPAGSSSQTVLPFTGLKNPLGVAVDSAGNVYVAYAGNSRVLKLPVQ
jgi:serine/threonine-protein kinase